MQKNPSFIDVMSQTPPDTLLNEDAIRGVILRLLHPNGVFCPICGMPPKTRKSEQNFWNGGRIFCLQCKKFFAATSLTFLHNRRHSFSRIYLVALLLSVGAPHDRIAELFGIGVDTVGEMQARFAAASLVDTSTT